MSINIQEKVVNCYLNTMKVIDKAILNKLDYDISHLISRDDENLLNIAMSFGDVVPVVFIETIEESLCHFNPDYEGAFSGCYKKAVKYYKESNLNTCTEYVPIIQKLKPIHMEAVC